MRMRCLALPLLLAACTAGSDELDRPFQNWQAHRFEHMQRQRTDFTCGSASLSTIATYYYGKPIKEVAFTAAIRKTYSKEVWNDVEKNGLSMLDLKRAAEAFGFAAEGLKLSLAQLKELKGPLVVHLDKGFIKHFSVFKGIEGDRAYLADPISGNSREPLYRFLDEWTGYALAVWIDGEELPATNRLMVSPRDVPNELQVGRDALYASPPLTAFSLFAH
jgi:predicted double-glycine peptidase